MFTELNRTMGLPWLAVGTPENATRCVSIPGRREACHRRWNPLRPWSLPGQGVPLEIPARRTPAPPEFRQTLLAAADVDGG